MFSIFQAGCALVEERRNNARIPWIYVCLDKYSGVLDVRTQPTLMTKLNMALVLSFPPGDQGWEAEDGVLRHSVSLLFLRYVLSLGSVVVSDALWKARKPSLVLCGVYT